MSNFITTHKTVDYDSKKSAAFDGQRLCKVTFKTTANVIAPMHNKCVSIPPVDTLALVARVQDFMPHLLAVVEQAQDDIVRAKLLEAGGDVEMQDSELSMDAVLLQLAEAAKGNRLSKDSISAWFDAQAADMLTVAISDKLGISDAPSEAEAKKVAAIVADYSTKLQSLAGSKTTYSPEVATKLQRALEVAEVKDTAYGSMFWSKLEAMKVKPAADLLAL